MIDTDTRQLKLQPDGMYKSGAKKVICDHCGHRETCPLLPLQRCSLFMPTIPFQDETGLHAVANTVRVGKAWMSRLHIGQTIGLYNTVSKEIFAHAEVIHLASGPIAGMLKSHAHANHLMVEQPCGDAPIAIYKWLKRNYGPRIIHETTSLTAIYLLVLSRKIAETDFEGGEAMRSLESSAALPGKDTGNP